MSRTISYAIVGWIVGTVGAVILAYNFGGIGLVPAMFVGFIVGALAGVLGSRINQNKKNP